MPASERSMSAERMQRLTFIVAGDPAQRTGGYLYDAHIVAQLRHGGWQVEVIGLAGRFPDADEVARDTLRAALSSLPDDSLVVIDGLALGGLPETVAPHAQRLRLIALVHHPLADECGLETDRVKRFERQETAALQSMRGVITTSRFTARRVAGMGIDTARIAAVEPGVAPQPLAAADHTPPRLLCVATLTPRKGHDLLVEALARVADLDWQCDFVGSASRDPDHAARVSALIRTHGLANRIHVRGECSDAGLHAAYAAADLFVLPSYYEGYGMVISEALAAGLPVLTTTGGALVETLPPGTGLAVPPGDSEALAQALRRLLANPAERLALRDGARAARVRLADWTQAGATFATALERLSGLPPACSSSPHPDTVFDADWLALRRAADHAARDPRLNALAADWLAPRGHRPLRILDLGTGSGSNPQYLAPRLPGPQRWTLLDHDPALLVRAVETCRSLNDRDGHVLAVEPLVAALQDLDASLLADFDLVTASALLDLVDERWLQRLADACREAGCALLIALSVDGNWRIETLDNTDSARQADATEDAFVRAAFNAHQRRDKGAGRALGPDAAPRLAAVLRARGFAVELAPSPWQLSAATPAQAALARALLDGWREAATEQRPEAHARIAAWHRHRLSELAHARLRIEVGHLDLLALPPSRGAG